MECFVCLHGIFDVLYDDYDWHVAAGQFLRRTPIFVVYIPAIDHFDVALVCGVLCRHNVSYAHRELHEHNCLDYVTTVFRPSPMFSPAHLWSPTDEVLDRLSHQDVRVGARISSMLSGSPSHDSRLSVASSAKWHL
jgi:hypothetical protein